MKKAPLQLNLFGDATPVAPAAEPRPPSRTPTAAVQAPARPQRNESRELAERLNRLTGGRVRDLVLTDNQSRIVSARPAKGGIGNGDLDVRIHRCFAGAPEATLRSVAAFLQSERRGPTRLRALRTIREHFAAQTPGPRERSKRRPKLRPAGEIYDLREMRDAVNRAYFGGELEVAITWGRALPGQLGPWRPARRRRRRCGFSIQLGSYEERRQLVRIHRCLDRVDVPRFVVESVVYHEMLHAAVPPVVRNGRRSIHTPEFKRRERLFRHHRPAARWIDDNLERLAALR